MGVYTDNSFTGAQWREWCILTGNLGKGEKALVGSFGSKSDFAGEDVVYGLYSRQKEGWEYRHGGAK